MYTNDEIEKAWNLFEKAVRLGKTPPDYDKIWKDFAMEKLRLKYKVSKKNTRQNKKGDYYDRFKDKI